MIKKNFGEILRKSRKYKGLSQGELAQQTEVHKRSIIYWEQGEQNISLGISDYHLKNCGEQDCRWLEVSAETLNKYFKLKSVGGNNNE